MPLKIENPQVCVFSLCRVEGTPEPIVAGLHSSDQCLIMIRRYSNGSIGVYLPAIPEL